MFKKRKHIRLRNFDYASANSYFITVCVKNRECSLGTIKNGIMGLSEIGNAASLMLEEMCEKWINLSLNEFIIMPDHVHFIISIKNGKYSSNVNRFSKPLAGSLSMAVNHYKGKVKKWCNSNGFEFEWQSRYYDHVIRYDEEYDCFKNYIINNPRIWQKKELRKIFKIMHQKSSGKLE